MKSWLRRAREASGLQVEQCACALCCSRAMFLELEEHPGFISVDELRALLALLEPDGVAIVQEALMELFPQDAGASCGGSQRPR